MLPDKLKKVFCNPKHWNFLNNHLLFVFTFLSVKIYTVSSIVHLSSFAVCMLLAFIPHPILLFLIICRRQLYNTDPPGCQGLKRPYQGWGGGGPMLPVWILKRLVLVFINACRLLLALPSLSQFGQGRLSLVAISFYTLSLLFGPGRLSEFTLAGPLLRQAKHVD